MFNNIRHLKYVSTVAKCGSLFEAARTLMVSESTVSAAIKSCEQELGYSIFIRRPSRPLILTPTGAEFVRSAQHFVDHAEAFYDASNASHDTCSCSARSSMGSNEETRKSGARHNDVTAAGSMADGSG